MALENRLDDAQQGKPGRASVLEQKLEKKSSWPKIILDAALYVPVAAASAFLFGTPVLLSTAIPAFGYSLGAWLENRKKKMRTTWNKLKKEIYTGNIMGHVDYALFSMPELIFKAAPSIFNAGSFAGMLAAGLVINPLFFVPVNIAYEAFYHIRDNYGLKNILKSPFNGKIIKYVRETYQHVKKNLWQDTKNVLKMFPLHFFQMHYLPNAPLRMAQSAFINNPIYRKLTSGKPTKQIHDENYASTIPATNLLGAKPCNSMAPQSVYAA